MTVLQIFVDSSQCPLSRLFSGLTIPVSAIASYMNRGGKKIKKRILDSTFFLAPSHIQLILTPTNPPSLSFVLLHHEIVDHLTYYCSFLGGMFVLSLHIKNNLMKGQCLLLSFFIFRLIQRSSSSIRRSQGEKKWESICNTSSMLLDFTTSWLVTLESHLAFLYLDLLTCKRGNLPSSM